MILFKLADLGSLLSKLDKELVLAKTAPAILGLCIIGTDGFLPRVFPLEGASSAYSSICEIPTLWEEMKAS